MQKVARKIIIGVMTTLLVSLTTIATTFAWVGMLTFSTTGDIDLNIKVENNQSQYFLLISSDGKNFSDNVKLEDIQRNILKNYNLPHLNVDNISDENISREFNRIKLFPVTTTVSNNKIQKFQMFDKGSDILVDTDEYYYKFDLYLTVDSKDGINLDSTLINSNVFLNDIEKTLTGTLGTDFLINPNPFDSLPSDGPFGILKSINKDEPFTIDSKNATRFAIEIYNPTQIGEPDNQTNPLRTIIYQGGSQMPYYDEKTGVYNLGGNLPEDYNLAIKEINSTYNRNLIPPKEIINRGDKELIKENSLIWEAPNEINGLNYLGVQNGIQTKLKLTIYFWFEGWDADCLKNINKKETRMNLIFTSDMDKID